MTDYTHNFELQFDGFEMTGECEFNLDGQASYNTEDPISNLTVAQSERITVLFHELKRLFNAFGNIEKIEIIKK